jgi:hypothetical protein
MSYKSVVTTLWLSFKNKTKMKREYIYIYIYLCFIFSLFFLQGEGGKKSSKFEKLFVGNLLSLFHLDFRRKGEAHFYKPSFYFSDRF